MLTVTDNAKQLLKETLLAHTDEAEFGLRLLVKPPGQFGLVLDRKSPDDTVIEHEGSKVLLVGHWLDELLDRVTIDVQDTPDGPKLAIFQSSDTDSQIGG